MYTEGSNCKSIKNPCSLGGSTPYLAIGYCEINKWKLFSSWLPHMWNLLLSSLFSAANVWGIHILHGSLVLHNNLFTYFALQLPLSNKCFFSISYYLMRTWEQNDAKRKNSGLSLSSVSILLSSHSSRPKSSFFFLLVLTQTISMVFP